MVNTAAFSYSTFTEFQERWLTEFNHLLNLRAKTNTCRECHVTLTSETPFYSNLTFYSDPTTNVAADWRFVFRQGKTTV